MYANMSSAIIPATPDYRYVDTAETAQYVRDELKATFPGVKFSVRSKRYSGGSSIDVSWVDGPTSKQVQAVTSKFEGSDFDGMQDLKTSKGTITYKGERVRFLADYVFEQRAHSVAFLTKIATEQARRFGQPVPEVIASTYSDGAYVSRACDCLCSAGCNLWDEIMRAAQETSAYSAKTAKPSQKRARRAPAPVQAPALPAVETSIPASPATPTSAEASASASPASAEQGVTIEQSGDWVWVSFAAKPADDVLATLRALAFRWSAKRHAWYRTSPLDRDTIVRALAGDRGEAASRVTSSPASAVSPVAVVATSAASAASAAEGDDNEPDPDPEPPTPTFTRRQSRAVEHLPADIIPIERYQRRSEREREASEEQSAPARFAEKLRASAASLSARIADKERPMTQRWTNRRASLYSSRLRDADMLERERRAFLALAEAIERDALPPVLAVLDTITAVRALLTYDRFPSGDAYLSELPKLYRLGLHQDNFSAARTALLDLRDALQPADRATAETSPAERVRALEMELVGKPILDWYPTPRAVGLEMADLLDVRPHHRVLEPSAGDGALCDALRAAATLGRSLDCVEFHPTLAALLDARGYHVVARDIVRHTPAQPYDRIIANFPFSAGQDIEHLMYCYRHLLAPGGRIVAIMSAGTFTRGDGVSTRFRQWFSEQGGEVVRTLESGTFSSSEARYQATSARGVIVRMERPASV